MTTPKSRFVIVSLFVLPAVWVLAACGGGLNATASVAPTLTVAAGNGSPPVATPATPGQTSATPTVAAIAPGAAATPSSSAPTPATAATATTSAPTPATAATATTGAAAAATPTEDESARTGYLDDRSGPAELMMSYYNAINRHEYLRAYSYWASGTDASQLPSYEDFVQGYADTAEVSLTIGTITGDAGAGQRYFSVPIELDATTTGGRAQTFFGCYQLHLAQPALQASPPFEPLAIQKADVREIDNGSGSADLLATACPAQTGQPLATVTPGQATGADASLYVDNRSTPSDVLRSLYNAINRQEYARAYSYWAPDAAQLPAFDQFQQGYAQTTSVALTTGTLESDPGAGQLNYALPATLVAQQADGSTQTFVGCYRLHLSQPAIQATPPFQPLAITEGTLRQVDNTADTSALMAAACQP